MAVKEYPIDEDDEEDEGQDIELVDFWKLPLKYTVKCQNYTALNPS